MQPVEGTIDVAIVGTPTLSHAQCLFGEKKKEGLSAARDTYHRTLNACLKKGLSASRDTAC
jgi:hypothetical protein